MPKKIEWKWEMLEESPASSTKRIKVMGGWLVVHKTFCDLGTQKAVMSESSVFIADKDYEWMPTAPIIDAEVNRINLAKDYEVQKV